MDLKISTIDGWTELIIYDDCSFDKAYSIANILKKTFKLTFSQKLEDLESFYWDFQYNCNTLTLHYNIFAGLRIFPVAFKQATDADNNSVTEVGLLLSKHFTRSDLKEHLS